MRGWLDHVSLCDLPLFLEKCAVKEFLKPGAGELYGKSYNGPRSREREIASRRLDRKGFPVARVGQCLFEQQGRPAISLVHCRTVGLGVRTGLCECDHRPAVQNVG